MRLIYFIPLLSTVGGQERTLTDKANYLASKGHDVLFVTYEHEGALAYELDPAVRHVDVSCHSFSLYAYPFWRRPWEMMMLKRRFRKVMKDVLTDFHPDVIVIAIPNTENFICDVLSVADGIPVVIESHLAQGYQVIKRGLTEKLMYFIWNPIKAIKHSSLLIALTEGDAACWKKFQVGNVRVIPNPVILYNDHISSKEKEQGRIICVGRFTPQKRFDRLIEAFSLIADKYPTWHVDIYGDGEDKEKLQKQILEKNLTHRIILNPPTKDIYSEYLKSQFFVLSSDFEGFGLVIVEAMACGLPVVATDCPYGPSEIVEDGVTGVLSKMEVTDLAAKIEWMITHETERQSMGQTAHQVVAKYRKEIIMKEWENAYLSVIK